MRTVPIVLSPRVPIVRRTPSRRRSVGSSFRTSSRRRTREAADRSSKSLTACPRNHAVSRGGPARSGCSWQLPTRRSSGPDVANAIPLVPPGCSRRTLRIARVLGEAASPQNASRIRISSRLRNATNNRLAPMSIGSCRTTSVAAIPLQLAEDRAYLSTGAHLEREQLLPRLAVPMLWGRRLHVFAFDREQTICAQLRFSHRSRAAMEVADHSRTRRPFLHRDANDPQHAVGAGCCGPMLISRGVEHARPSGSGPLLDVRFFPLWRSEPVERVLHQQFTGPSSG